MTSRDDMVLPAHVTEAEGLSSPVPERKGRRLLGNRPKSGVLQRMAFARLARIAASRGASSSMLARIGSRAVLTATSATLLAAIVAAVALRIGSGRTFKNLGQLMNDGILGDMDEEARATYKAKMRVFTNTVLRGVSQEGRADHVVGIFQGVKERLMETEQGRAIALRVNELTEDSSAEQLMMRGKSILEDAFRAAGGNQAIDELRRQLRGLGY